ncbi:reverse transcriptase-like protein, partial [Mycobacterium kansasii]
MSTEYEAKENRMIAYLDEARKLIGRFWNCTIHQIPRAENSWADALEKLASAAEGKIPRIIPVEFIEHPSIEQLEIKEVNPVQNTPSWMDPIVKYLVSGEIPSDKAEAKRLQV